MREPMERVVDDFLYDSLYVYVHAYMSISMYIGGVCAGADGAGRR